MDKITYADAKAYFQKHQTHWEALCLGIEQLREEEIAIMKRNISTPSCADREYLNQVSVGRMTAFDDVLWEFRTDDGQPSTDVAAQPNQ